MLQSLFKDYNLSDQEHQDGEQSCLSRFNPSSRITTFRTSAEGENRSGAKEVSIPLQGLQPFGLFSPKQKGKTLKRFNPSSGITTFRTAATVRRVVPELIVSIPLQGLQPFGRKPKNRGLSPQKDVSIPLQGLQPFGLNRVVEQVAKGFEFQSLFKDYNLSDH